jgi:hypothetical protein
LEEPGSAAGRSPLGSRPSYHRRVGHQWIGRLFDEDAALARFITLSVQALGDLRLLTRPEDALAWTLALGGLAVCLAGQGLRPVGYGNLVSIADLRLMA